jgi:hypothetical protein
MVLCPEIKFPFIVIVPVPVITFPKVTVTGVGEVKFAPLMKTFAMPWDINVSFYC